MTALFASPEFAEIPIYRNGTSGDQIGMTRLRLEVNGGPDAFEVSLVDRAYCQYQQPVDVRVTPQGSFPTLQEARKAINDFISAYQRAHEEDLLERFRDAFQTLICDPAASTLQLPGYLTDSESQSQATA